MTEDTATGYPPVDATDRLMSALALHPDMYATVLDAFADAYEAGAGAGVQDGGDTPAQTLTAIARLGERTALYADSDIQALGRAVADLARGHATIADVADRLPGWELDGLLDGITADPADEPTVHSAAAAAGWNDPLPASVLGGA